MNDRQSIITRSKVSEGRLSNNGFLGIVFLGGSFFGFVLFLIAIRFGHPIDYILLLIGATVFALAMGPRSHPILVPIAWYFGSLVILIVTMAILFGLANLASNGVFSPDKSGATEFQTEIYLATAVFWLLFGVPHRAFKYQIDPRGEENAQKAVLGLLVLAASILTGALILLLHFSGGPLRKADFKTLVIGTIFTVFLLAPGYKSIARACWKRGSNPITHLRIFLHHWGGAAEEVKTALRQRRAARRAKNSTRATGALDSGTHNSSLVQPSHDNRTSPLLNNSSQPEKKIEHGGVPRNRSGKGPGRGRGASPTRKRRRRRRH